MQLLKFCKLIRFGHFTLLYMMQYRFLKGLDKKLFVFWTICISALDAFCILAGRATRPHAGPPRFFILTARGASGPRLTMVPKTQEQDPWDI